METTGINPENEFTIASLKEKKKGISPNLRIFNTDIETVENISHFDDAIMVEMGGIKKIDTNEIIFSQGANPCIIIVAKLNDGSQVVMHSMGEGITLEQENILQNTKNGFAGGGPDTLKKLGHFLFGHNIKSVYSNDSEADFNVSVVNKNNTEYKKGVYYCYNNINEDNEENTIDLSHYTKNIDLS